MKKAVLALATAATIAVTALAIPSPAEARWRGGVTFNGYAYSPGYDSGYTYYGRYAPPYGYGGSPLITGYVPTILYSTGVRPPPLLRRIHEEGYSGLRCPVQAPCSTLLHVRQLEMVRIRH